MRSVLVALLVATLSAPALASAQERTAVVVHPPPSLPQGTTLVVEVDGTVVPKQLFNGLFSVTPGRKFVSSSLVDAQGNRRTIRQSEIEMNTGYNTYRIDGLPPTPISNPGRAALEATANPAQSNAIFFVADGTGGHIFASTLAEHNANVARWREIEAQRLAAERAGR